MNIGESGCFLDLVGASYLRATSGYMCRIVDALKGRGGE